MRSCNFDCYGLCGAKVCYSNEKCNSKDENGSPKYATNDWAIINHLRDTIEAQQQEIESLKNWNACEAEEHERLIKSDKRRIELEEEVEQLHAQVAAMREALQIITDIYKTDFTEFELSHDFLCPRERVIYKTAVEALGGDTP